MGKEYTSLSSSLCSFLHSPVTSSLLGPNILLNTLFSNTLSLRFSLNVRDQISQIMVALQVQMHKTMRLHFFLSKIVNTT